MGYSSQFGGNANIEGNDMSDKANLSIEELHARMLKKQLWVVMTKAVAPPEPVRRSAPNGTRSIPSSEHGRFRPSG